MTQIKIFTKGMVALTAFNVGEYHDLAYTKTLGQIGSASFVVPLSNAKVITANMRPYNRVQIITDGVVSWYGYIVTKQINFNEVTIGCKEIIGILGKRLTTDAYVMSGAVSTVVPALLSTINGIDATGITMGVCDIATTINMTFNQQDVLSVLQSIAANVGGQFLVNNNGTLDFRSQVGSDKHLTVILSYNILQPQRANLLNFNVQDNGEGIVSRAFGANAALVSQQDSSGFQTLYGIIEKFTNFSAAGNQTNLDRLTAAVLSDTLYTPTLNLTPTALDNFDVADVIAVNISNKLVVINNSFQVLQKDVKITGSQKTMSVKINALPQDIVSVIRDLQKQVNLLVTN